MVLLLSNGSLPQFCPKLAFPNSTSITDPEQRTNTFNKYFSSAAEEYSKNASVKSLKVI